jgi:hypothetical protein
MAESYKAMAADTKRYIGDRMEAAEKASLLSLEVGAQAYKAIASDTRLKYGRRRGESYREEAARKSGRLSAEVGAEAYKAIASDTSVSPLSRKKRGRKGRGYVGGATEGYEVRTVLLAAGLAPFAGSVAGGSDAMLGAANLVLGTDVTGMAPHGEGPSRSRSASSCFCSLGGAADAGGGGRKAG